MSLKSSKFVDIDAFIWQVAYAHYPVTEVNGKLNLIIEGKRDALVHDMRHLRRLVEEQQ